MDSTARVILGVLVALIAGCGGGTLGGNGGTGVGGTAPTGVGGFAGGLAARGGSGGFGGNGFGGGPSCQPPSPPSCGALCGNGRIDSCVVPGTSGCPAQQATEACDGNDLG